MPPICLVSLSSPVGYHRRTLPPCPLPPGAPRNARPEGLSTLVCTTTTSSTRTDSDPSCYHIALIHGTGHLFTSLLAHSPRLDTGAAAVLRCCYCCFWCLPHSSTPSLQQPLSHTPSLPHTHFHILSPWPALPRPHTDRPPSIVSLVGAGPLHSRSQTASALFCAQRGQPHGHPPLPSLAASHTAPQVGHWLGQVFIWRGALLLPTTLFAPHCSCPRLLLPGKQVPPPPRVRSPVREEVVAAAPQPPQVPGK